MSGSGKLKRRHHTVPRFYLERFANERRMLVRVPLAGPRSHLASIGDASVERDFYLIEREDGTQTDALEDLLAEAEGHASRSVRAVVNEGVWPMPVEHRHGIALWAASQALRTTANRQSGDEIADLVFKLSVGLGGKPGVARALAETLGREPTEAEVDAEWQHFSDFDSYVVRPHPNEHLKLLLELWPRATEMLLARAWSIVRFQHKALITSDNPLCLVPSPDHPEESGVGLETAKWIVLPLDRRVALIMRTPGAPEILAPPNASLARVLNEWLLLNAHTAVFHHPDDDPLAGLTLPEAGRRRVGGYENVKGMLRPEGRRSSIN